MNYAWGLDVDSNGRPIGALSVDPFSPDSGLAAFDPRKSNAAPARTLSGILNVNYRTGQAVQMATDVQETWSRQPSNIVKFKEQALLWLSGAEVFAHLRPEMRANIAGIFSDDLFPNNVHVLGMVILPAVERMLDKGFIDRDLRVFFDEFNIQVPAQQRIPANLESILLMTNAMTIWTQQLKDVSRADLPQSISSMLVGASDKLKPAVQLGILKVLERVQVLQAAGPGTSGRAALLEYPGGPLAPMSRTLEAAYIILNAESSLGSISPLVRERSAALIVHIVDAMQTGVADANAPETVLWLRAALEKMATVQPTSEFTQLLESLRKIMAGA